MLKQFDDLLAQGDDGSATWTNRVLRLLVEIQFLSLTGEVSREDFVSRVKAAKAAGVRLSQSLAVHA